MKHRDTSAPWAVLVLAVFLALVALASTSGMTEHIIRRLDETGILLGLVATSLVSAVSLLALLQPARTRTLLRKWLDPRSYELQRGVVADLRKRCRGVVIPVSRPPQASWILHHLKPEVAALVYSDGSREAALGLMESFSDSTTFLPLPEEVAQGLDFQLSDVHDPAKAKALAAHFVAELFRREISKDEILVDTTGGTAPMSIGCFLAAEEAGVSSIYVKGTESQGKRTSQILHPEVEGSGLPLVMSDRHPK